jgi:hypothetical protein
MMISIRVRYEKYWLADRLLALQERIRSLGLSKR